MGSSDAIEHDGQSNGLVADDEVLEERYRNSFGCRAGYLPGERFCINQWHRNLQLQGKLASPKSSPAVNKLRELIYTDPILRMYVTEMIDQVADEHKVVTDIDQMLQHLATVVITAPEYHTDPNQCHMFPMWELFAYMMGTPAGMDVFRNYSFNEGLRAVLEEWCKYLDSSDSAKVLTTAENGWLSPAAHRDYHLWEYELDMTKPHGGFASYNAFFHRAIKPSTRPVAEPNDPKVIVSTNDGYVIAVVRDVQRLQPFWLKGERYSLVDILGGSRSPITHKPYVDQFQGGDLFHTYLSGNDYHRFHAPVDGTVEDIVTPPNGLLFSVPEPMGDDFDLGESQIYYTAVNHRKLVFIAASNKAIGTVCMMPIGITDISSIRFRDGLMVGDYVRKGEEIGCFAYGGSSIVLLFQFGAVDHFTGAKPLPSGSPPSDCPPIKVNEQIAIAKSGDQSGAASMTT
ncbi:hypothetical protein M758_8G063400 [Ceratodon purpureus]|nr:hypothetical protein M758_8G063400 [Ceratodon purpureus]KAG0607900.1 hypothetical protein M758_8G063400 [Ceratodon purpureus]